MNRLLARVANALAIMWLMGPNLPRALALTPVEEVSDSTPIWQWVASVLMVAVCAAIVFKNAKRSHQN
jgi:hypothetical protein